MERWNTMQCDGDKKRTCWLVGTCMQMLRNLSLIPAWINNRIHHKARDVITYPFPNFSSTTTEVWEWISSPMPHFMLDVITYPCLSMLLKGATGFGRLLLIKWRHSKCLISSRETLQWRHNGHDNVSNHQSHDCLFNRLFKRRSKETSKLRVTGLCGRDSPVTGEFPAQRASNAENNSI